MDFLQLSQSPKMLYIRHVSLSCLKLIRILGGMHKSQT